MSCPTLAATKMIALPAPPTSNMTPPGLQIVDCRLQIGGQICNLQSTLCSLHRALVRHFADVLGDAHGAELRPAHRAELGGLEPLLRQRLVVHRPSRVRIQRQLELTIPVELETRLRQLVVA